MNKLGKKGMQKEINRQKVVIERLKARTEAKYLHKLEIMIKNMRVIIRTKDLHIAQLKKEIDELKSKIAERIDQKKKGEKEMIYYLAHPWSNDPEESFKNAVKWTRQLREKGYYVFSPILHTHPYWKELKKTKNEKEIEEIKQPKAEILDIPEIIKGEIIKKIEEKEIEEYLKKENWLDWDLKFVKAFMNHDSKLICPKCEGKYNFECVCGGGDAYHCYNCGWYGLIRENEWWDVNNKENHTSLPLKYMFDSGVIMLMSKTAYYCDSDELQGFSWVDKWRSKGCKKEYEYAKSRNIRVLDLKSFLEGKEVEI